MFYAISESFASLNDFMTAGGPVLWLIAFLAFFMWALIIEECGILILDITLS